MRFQEQRIPSTHFSQHLQGQDQVIRDNLNFAAQTNRRMKEDIQAAKRKLNSSSSTGLIRNNAFFQQTQNNRNLVNVQQRPNRSNNFSDNLTPQYNTQSQFFRKVGPEVPEEADQEFEVLRREIVEARKQNEGLRQVITQNDASARFAISQLQSTIDAVRAENERIKINYELLSKQNNDQRINKNSSLPQGACSKCQKMERRIKELEDLLAETNSQLDKELKKRAEANQTNSTFRSQLSERLRSMEEKLLKGNQQILKYQSLNFELTRKLSESQQREFYFTEQLNTLSQQLANTTEIKTRISFDYERMSTENERLRNESETVEKRYLETINQVAYLSSKVEAINAEIIGSQDRGKADLTVGLGELQQRVGELRYRLEEKTTENRQYEIRIAEKDASMKKLSEEYGECLEKIEHLEQALAHYRQSSEELQVELDRIRSQESPASQEKAEQTANQLRLEEEIHAEYVKVQNLNQQLQQKDETVNNLRLQLQEIHNYLHTITINSQKTVQQLNLTITHLYQQSQAAQRRNGELEAIVSKSKQEISENSFDIVREREEIVATREELRRKAQYYEEALQEINNQYQRNNDLEKTIDTLKSQLNNSQANFSVVEQRLASSESQRLRLEVFIGELNIRVSNYEEQNAFFVSQMNEYRHRVLILEQEVIKTRRIIEEKQEIFVKKDKEIKQITILLNNERVSSGQGQQNNNGFYQKKLFEAERYIQQVHQTTTIQQQALAQQNQEIEALKGENLRYKQIIDDIAVKQAPINEEISRNEVVRRSLEDKLSHLQPLLRQQSEKNAKSQKTIEIQQEEIERLNALVISKDSEFQLIKRDFTILIDENTELRGHHASLPTNNDFKEVENIYRKKIEQLERQFNGWTNQLNSNLQAKQDEINRLTSQLTLLRSQGNLQPRNRQEGEANEAKLFKAERYIEELLHINISYEQAQQERQQQITILQEKLRNIEPLFFELQNDNKNLREIVSRADSVAKTQPINADPTVLENRIQQSEQRLQNEIAEGTKLKQAIEILSEQLRQEKATAVNISNESKTNQEKAGFFEQKLIDAEAFITQLLEKEKEYNVIFQNNEKARYNDGVQIASLSSQLQGASKQIEELTVNLNTAKNEDSAIKKKVAALEQQLSNIQNQKPTNELSKANSKAVPAEKPAEDLRKKFEAAEEHIRYLQEALRGQNSHRQQALINFQSQNNKLLKELANAGQKSSKDFLSSKLQDAQAHIRYLQQELPSEHLLTIEKLQKYLDQAEQKAKQNEAQGQEQISSLTFLLHNSQQQLSELENLKNQFEQLYRQTLHEKNLNDQALIQKQAQIKSLEKQIGELQQGANTSVHPKISELQILAQDYANQAANAESKLYEAEAYIQQFLAKELLYVRLETENKDIKGHFSNLEQALLKSQAENQDLVSKLIKTQATIKSLTKPVVNQGTVDDKSQEKEALLRDLKTIFDEKQFFRVKLLDAEQHIHYLTHEMPNQHLITITKLQKHLDEAEGKTIAWEKKVLQSEKQNQAQLTILAENLRTAEKRLRELEGQRDKIAHFQKLASTHQRNLEQYQSKAQKDISNLKQQNTRLRDALAHAEEQLHKLSQIQLITEERLRSRESEIINLSAKLEKDQTSYQAVVNEDAQFFKNKLMQAQAFLVQLEQQNGVNQSVIAQKEQELKSVGGKITQAEDIIKALEDRNSLLTQEIEMLQKANEQLRENVKNTLPKSEISSLEIRLKQSNQKLQSEITEGNKLRKVIETFSEQLRQEKATTAKSINEIQAIQDKAAFLENKLLAAESYISQLQKKEKVEDDKQETAQLKASIEKVNSEKERLLGEVKAATDEREFFKGKLNDAEAHINYLQNELSPNFQANKKELDAVKEKASLSEKASAEKIASLSVKIQGASKQIEELTVNLNTAKNEDSAIKKKVAALEQQLSNIQNQKPTNELSKANSKAVPAEKPAEDLREKLEAAEEYIRYLQGEIGGYLNTIQVLHKEVDNFRKKVSENEAKQNQILNLSAQLQGALKHIEELTNNLQDEEKKVYRLSQTLTKAASVPQVEPSCIQQTNKETIESYKANLALADQQIKRILEENAAKNQMLSHLSKENNASKEQLIILQKELINSKAQNKVLLDELAKAEKVAKDQDNSSNQDREFFKHKLVDAEEHIAYLENHRIKELQNTIQQLEKRINEANRKIKHEAQNEGKNQPQIAVLTKRISELQILAGEREKLEAEKNALQRQNAEVSQKLISLQEDKQTANERANYSENLLMETIKQLEDLKQKMKDVEDYLYNVQIENSMLKEAVNASVPTESIYTLPEYVSLEEKVKLLEEQNQRLEQIQQAKASSLEAKDVKQPIEDSAFFKSKLLEAERYIEEIEHINLVNQQIIHQQNDDIKNLGAKIAQLETVNTDLVKDNSIINGELKKAKDTNNQLKEAVTSLASPEKMVALENLKKQAETKLSQKIKEMQDLKAELNSLKLQNKEKDEQINSIIAEKESSDNEAAFFKQKLFDAQSYITALEEAEHSNEELNNKLKKFVELQEQLESLKKIKNTLSKQAEAKSLKIANLEKATQQLSQEGEFFKRKLLDAETHIKFLEEELANIGNIEQTLDQLATTEQKAKEWQEKAKNIENRNKQLALMNHQLLNQLNEPRQTGQIQKLEDSLVQLKSRLLESEANNRELLDQLMEERSENSMRPDKSDFFKEKLLEAQSYIHELEGQNGVLSSGIETLKNQVESLKEECKERENQINNYAQDLRESEVEKEALQLRNIELEQKIDPLTKKIEILDGQLAREQEVSNKEVQNLAKKLEIADAKLKEAQRQLQQQIDNEAKLVEQKLAAEARAQKYENLSNTLQQTLNLFDSLHKPFSEQEESIEQLKEQLHAAEKREKELKIIGAAKDNVLNNLQAEIEKESTDNQQLREKIVYLLTENAALRTENDDLNKQLQELKHIDVPVTDNSSILRNLQEQQDKYNQMMRQLEQLTDRIKLTEELNFQIKSLKEIAENKVKQNETIIKVLEEKVRSEKYIPIENQNNKIEMDFMDEKLAEAQELITQQQNEINRLTEELIHQQNQFLKYSGDLTNKIEEENNLNNVVKELSNSRRLLNQKIRNLEIENEAIKLERLQQSKQLEAAGKEIQTVQETISTLLQEKAVADDIAEVSKEKLQHLEDKYSTLLSEAAQLKESLKQKDQKIALLENTQKNGKVDNAIATESNTNKEKLYQAKINEIQQEKLDLQANNNTLQDQLQQYQEIIATLNGQIVEKESERIILLAEKDKLSKQLENQLSKSLKLEQQQEQSNQQFEQIQGRQNGLKSKLAQLEEELQNGNNMIEQLLDEKVESEQKIADLQKAVESLKAQKDKEIAALLKQASKNEENIEKNSLELEAKNQQIQVLNNQINPLNTEKEQILKHSGEQQQEISTLKAAKEDSNIIQTLTARLSYAEDYIAQLEGEKQNVNQIFKDLTTQITSMKEEVETLRNDLNNSITEKQRLAEAISDLQNEIQLAQSDNQRLTSKVSYLQSANEIKDKEIADLSEFSLNKQANPNEKSGNKAEGNPNANVLPDQYKESNDSMQDGKNDLEKSKKQEDQHTIKELKEQIHILTAELQSKEEVIRQLIVEKVNIVDENKELYERLNNQNIDNEEQLKQHLVQVDRANFELQEENKQLLNDLQLLAKDKAYLEGEINQLKAKGRLDNSEEDPKTPEKDAKKIYRQVSEPKSEGYNISLLQEEIEQLKQQLAEERIKGDELLSLEVDNDALKHSKQQLQDKLQKAESERLRLLLKLKDAQEAIARQQDECKAEQQHFLKEKSQLEENLKIAERRINKLEEKQQGQGQASLGENLKKILDLTKSFNEEIEPEDITQHLQNYPYLNELITSILYRLRLSTALELEKSIKIKQLTEELAQAQRNALEASDLRTANAFLKREIEKLQEQLRDKQTQYQKRYEEVFEELVFYETLNKELEGKTKEISVQYQQQKDRLDVYEKQISTPILDNSGLSPQDSDLSRENYELRQKLQSSERAIQQFKSAADSSGSMNTKDVFYLEFLNTCLGKVVDLQREVQEVERDIEQAAALETSQRNTSSRNEDGKGSDSALQDKLQELEDKLLKNAQNIREHQQRSDNELFELLKELSEVKELPQFNKNRIDDYLTQLQNQILKDHEQHINQVSRLRDQLAASQQQSGRSNESLDEFNKVNKDKLLKEINNLNNTIEIYHQQSMRRKKNYKRTIESLLRDIEKLKERQETLVAQGKKAFDEPLNQAMLEITDKLRYAIQKDEEEDAKQIDLGEDDFIISNNYVQILDGREKDGKNLSGLQENFGQYMEKNVESAEVQTEEDHKPFLSFILSNQNLDKEDIRLLKKKIADMRAKEVQENLQALRAQEKKLEEVLMMGNRENPQQLDNIILTLANNYSRDEISQIFGSQDQDEILNKLNQALCMEDSFYKGENSSTIMKDIQERMLRHYESPTKLSEQVYTHLINLLSAKKDEQFYDEIELLFRDLFEIQAGFEQALRKKDELYRVHNERMNQIFNRSSSDGSEEYLTIFERENNEDPLQMHSQRKPRNSQHEDEVER